MDRKTHPTLIGAFVVCAIALGFGAILVFGSGAFFAKRHVHVICFDRSIKGLTVGAPVMFRGVEIGSVTDITVRVNQKNFTFYIPVHIQIKRGRIDTLLGDDSLGKAFFQNSRELITLLIDRGLRAQLQLESLLTGKLFVQLDFHPDTPVNLIGIDPRYNEIPTIPSSMEELSHALERLPLQEIATRAMHTIEGIDRLVNSPEIPASITALHEALQSLKAAADSLDRTLGPATAGFSATADAARETLRRLQQVLDSVGAIAAGNSPVMYDLRKTMEDLGAAARSMRVMTDYLERHPEALLRGKYREQRN